MGKINFEGSIEAEAKFSGDFTEPAEDLKFDIFANSLRAQVLTYGN